MKVPACAGLLALALALAPGASAQQQVCTGDTSAAAVPRVPAPPLDLGINPAGEAGALGPAVPVVPERPEATLAALAQLRPPGARLPLRLNRFFWSDGEAGIQRFLALTRRYTDAGYPVTLQLRYHPTPEQEGDVAGFVRWVREVVDRFGPNPLVVALQVTNEVNFTISPDSSDGAYDGGRDALIQGVIAADDEARRRGFDQLTVGFNWVYRTDPSNEASFWGYLRDKGGPAFVRALDWVGLDAYPGTVFPPAEAPGGYRDGMVNAMSSLRQCWLPIPGIPASVPIRVDENGWPTGPGRPEDTQAQALEEMVRAVSDFRGTYHVDEYLWFDLRDHDSASENFQHHYGLLRDDYSPKPAFAAYRRLVAELTARGAGGASAPAAPPTRSRDRPRLSLRVGYGSRRQGRRCAIRRVRLSVLGADRAVVRRADVLVGSRVAVRLRAAPRARLVRVGRRGSRSLRVRVQLFDGGRVTLGARVRRCAAHARAA